MPTVRCPFSTTHRFYFDIGFTLDKKEIRTENSEDLYELLDFKAFRGYSRFLPQEYYPKDKDKIKLTKNNQGYIVLDQKYKIVWSVKNPDKFYFTDHPIIFYMGKAAIICSNYDKEIYYMFSLLNSSITKLILKSNLRTENEKEYLLPIKPIKEIFRIPIIKKDNQYIKDELIKCTEEMLNLEECQLKDLVDFTDITKQKYDGVEIKGNNLILKQHQQEYKAHIKNKKDVVCAVLKEKYGDKSFLPGEIVLSDLKYLMALDKELQKSLKDYIDDLVFALYFNIPVKKIGLNQASQIKELCQKNEYYDYLQKEMQDNKD